jgi:hypothetical protein
LTSALEPHLAQQQSFAKPRGTAAAGQFQNPRRRFDHQAKLRALVGFAQWVASDGARESALRTDCEPIAIGKLGRLVNAARERIQVFKRRRLAANKAEHHALVLRHEPERLEVTRARRVVFEQEVADIRAGEEALGERLLAAFREICDGSAAGIERGV